MLLEDSFIIEDRVLKATLSSMSHLHVRTTDFAHYGPLMCTSSFPSVLGSICYAVDLMLLLSFR